jgi:hypothetical protein
MSIETILEQVKTATDWQTNKRLLRDRIQTDLQLPFSGGLFKITPDLIAFLNSWDSETIYLEDIYENPVEVNRTEFLYQAKEHYQRVMNRWHQEYNELRKIRKV